MKVLLIENQRTQFESIKILLTDVGNEVLPNDEDYKNFISNIKVILQGWKYYRGQGGQYPENRRELALTNFNDFIIIRKPDVILIDYRLSGSEDSGNGLDLAKLIRDMVNTPIIFLSRHSMNNSEIDRDYKKYNISNSFWVEKGYAGQALNDKEYFEKHVLEIIQSKIQFKLTLPEKDELIKTILAKIDNMIHKPNDYIYGKDENKRNQFIAEIEGNSKLFLFNLESPSNNDNNRTNQGRADIQIVKKDDGNQYSFIEAISVENPFKKSTKAGLTNLTDLHEHVERIYQYDRRGNDLNFLVIYYDGHYDSYSAFLDDFVSSIEPTFSHSGFSKSDLKIYSHSFGKSIFIRLREIRKPGYIMEFYYIILNCSKSLTR